MSIHLENFYFIKQFEIDFYLYFCSITFRNFVRLGEHDISSTTDGEIQDIKVVMTRRNENYNKRDGTNDIALLYLDHDANLSSKNRFSFNIRNAYSIAKF